MWQHHPDAVAYNLYLQNANLSITFFDTVKAPKIDYYASKLAVGTTYTFKLIILLKGGTLLKPKLALKFTTATQPVPVTCPRDYVQVPFDPTFGIYRDFCVMAYEAKQGPGGEAISQAENMPWNGITMTEAKQKCQELGDGYDLISNSEWMTIARNIEYFGANWNSGIVGEGCMTRGNSGAENICGYFKDELDFGITRDPRARLYLSTGASIWDFTGNLWEWVDWQRGGDVDLAPITCLEGWVELGSVACQDLNSELYLPLGGGLDSRKNGIGRFFGGFGGAAARGGAWSSTVSSGVYALYLKNDAYSAMSSVGFRCVYRP